MANPQDELEALRAQVAALTARVFRLEQKTGIEGPTSQETRPPAAGFFPPPPPPPPPAVSPSPPPHAPLFQTLEEKLRHPLVATHHKTAEAGGEEETLESTIGGLWLNRIGIVALLVGVSYFLKWAFENNLIGPAGRVAIGLVAGILVIVWSERFRKKGYKPFSYSLKAIGTGALYLSLWAAFQRYHLVDAGVAFAAMIVVTVFTVIMALTQEAEILAVYAMIGGFSTPLLVSTGENREIALLSYVVLLDLGILVMAVFKPWRRLLWGSALGTAILFSGWALSFYTRPQRDVTVLFVLVLAAVFGAVPLVTPLTRSRWHRGYSVTLTLLPLVNAAALFLALYLMYEREKVTLTWFALALAAVYLVLSNLVKRRAGSEPDTVKLINLLHVAIAVAFVTIAVPLKLDAHWITNGWLVESAVLLWIAVHTRAGFLAYFAATTLALGILRLLLIDNFETHALFFNPRFATYLVAIAILAWIVSAGERFGTEREQMAVRVSGVALSLLALVGLTLEASDYFTRQAAALTSMHGPEYRAALQQIELARNFSYSAIWLLYGAGLMAFGFWKRSAFVRYQGLVLMLATVGKVFLFDVSQLEAGYRVLSFIALGVVLVAISYGYHRRRMKAQAAAKAARASS